jgi:hypothetical protein
VVAADPLLEYGAAGSQKPIKTIGYEEEWHRPTE